MTDSAVSGDSERTAAREPRRTLPVMPEQPRDNDIRLGEYGREVFYSGEWYELGCTCDESGPGECIYSYPVTWPR